MKKVICLVGKSGSGKSMAAEYLGLAHGYTLVQSRTTRLPRFAGEQGHIFVSEDEFSSYKKEEMLAFTSWEQEDGSIARYCCLEADLKDTNTYVIDEFGLKYFLDNWSGQLDIISIRIFRSYDHRVRDVGIERVARDKGKFGQLGLVYDFTISNDGAKEDLFVQLDTIINTLN